MSEHTSLEGQGRDESAPALAQRSGSPEDLPWTLSYDRASVDRYLGEVEAERTRLRDEIAAAAAQAAASRARVTAWLDQVKDSLASAVFRMQQRLRMLESEHRELLATIDAAATVEAGRVRAAAERELTAMRASTAALAGIGQPPSSAPEPALATDPAGEGTADAG